MESTRERGGQSLMELLVGMAIGAVFLVGVASVIVPSLRSGGQATQVEEQAVLASQMQANLQSWAVGNWNGVLALATGTAHTYYLNASTSPFSSASGTESLTFQGVPYTRYFYLSDIYRDSGNNATTTVTGTYDPSTKAATIIVNSSGTLKIATTTLVFFLTRNANDAFVQTSWAGGSGQLTPISVVSTTYADESNVTISATGTIILTSGGGSCTF